jgi:hypothetical protein
MMKKILSLTFVALLLVPVVAGFVDPDFKTPEDRAGLKSPRLYTQALFDNRYYKAFDHYYNDSFSLRSPLVYAKRWLDYTIFRMTDSKAIHVGNEGWLYTRRSIEDLRKEACGREDVARQMALKLYALEKIIAASGRRFFFMVAPNKSTIYPEFTGYLPRRQVCNRSRYDLLLDAIARLPLKNFVRLDPLLKEARSGHALLYDKTGVYWNGMGALVAAEAIHRQMTADSRQEFAVEYTPAVGVDIDDLRRQLMGYKSTGADKSVRHFSGTGHPSGIVYGGDFIQEMRPYLQQMFNRLDVIQTDRLPSRQLGEDLRKYEVIILAVAESDLSEWEIDIAGLLAMFENDGPIADRNPFGLQSAKAISNISLNMDQSGLEIKSVGSASVFELQSLPASDEEIMRLLKLSFEAPHPDTMSINYLTDQPHVVDYVIKKGAFLIFLPLPVQKPAAIQIRPGHQPGVFRLRSAEIAEFSGHTDEEDRDQAWLIVAGTDLEDDFPGPSSVPESEAGLKIIDTELHPMESLAVSRMPTHENNELPENDDLFILSGDATDGNAPKPIKRESVQSLPNKTADNSVKNSDNRNPEMTGRSIKTATKKSAAASPVSITVTDFAEGRIFQRSGRGTAIAVSGTYSGKPGAIEARVVRDGTYDEVVAWTVIDASPQNGIYVGVIPDVPQGGWYNIQVRSSANHLILDRGTSKWGVGILVACLGQSNMKEWFHTGTDLMAQALVRKYNGKKWSKLGRQGNAAIAFSNQITGRLGIPVGLLDFSVNGSGLRKEANWGTGYWEDTSRHSIYSRFVAGVSKVGGAVEFVIWIQGEADAARGTVTEEEYSASLESFISKQVRGDIENGSHRRFLPFLVIAMVKRPGGKDDPHQAVRNAQYRVTEKIADCYLAATTLDLKNQGRQHLADSAYLTMGYRVAQTVLFVLEEETYYRGPSIAGARQIDSRTIDVSIEHRGGTDFTPDSDITGWEVLANGVSLPLTRIFRHDPQTIRIELERPMAQKTLIRYLYGAMPDTVRPVVDNSAMALPLEEGQSDVN